MCGVRSPTVILCNSSSLIGAASSGVDDITAPFPGVAANTANSPKPTTERGGTDTHHRSA
ncbi:hypothetical protein GCM10011581_49910 [Saccharopolyspora subtropica]|uniref:Uncharacterized protein n=1 Tax=Saccharopolyspora thermophila TaxID=89367 RepID=A0A917KDY4_9PSEU|nr:hypothetical protein GCM10011581_49910 [Saccharopolyspora subtropica]